MGAHCGAAGATSYSYPDRATFLADMVNVNVVIGDDVWAPSNA